MIKIAQYSPTVDLDYLWMTTEPWVSAETGVVTGIKFPNSTFFYGDTAIHGMPLKQMILWPSTGLDPTTFTNGMTITNFPTSWNQGG